MNPNWKIPKMAESHPMTHPQMATLRWSCSDPQCAADLARTVAELMRGAMLSWDGLPLWQATCHIQAKKFGGHAEVLLRLWPEPGSDSE